jgi:hypothetical protein
MTLPADIEVDGIVISDEKAAYIESRHGVTRGDVWEAFGNRPRYFVDSRSRYAMLGPVTSGRFLLAAIMPSRQEPGTWLLITAYWLSARRARAIYGGD